MFETQASKQPFQRASRTLALACAPLLIGCAVDAGDAPAAELGEVDQATTCGSTDESQHVNLYDGSFERFPRAFVAARKNPVGALERTASDSADAKFCSGTLISTNRFLTAGHCVGASTVGQFVAFNFELTLFPFVTVGPQSHVRVAAVLEDERGGVDYAILLLAGRPGDTFGVQAVGFDDPAPGAPIAMIGHPAGELKKVEAGTVDSIAGDRLHYFNLDTRGGSSGSGILNPSGEIVGVHTHGGCTPGGGTNSGTRIARIREVSNLL